MTIIGTPQRRRDGTAQQVLRLFIATYLIAFAMNLIPNFPGEAVLLLPAEIAAGVFSLCLFVGAWLILIGLQLRRVTLVLIILIILARLNTPLDGLQSAFIGDALLISGLLMIGGWIATTKMHNDAPGRIKLARVEPPKCTYRSAMAIRRKHAFSESPDDMIGLFDQVQVAK